MPGPGLISLTTLLILLAAGCSAVLPVQEISLPSNFGDTGQLQISLDKAHLNLERGSQKNIIGHIQTNQTALTPAFFVQGDEMRLEQPIISTSQGPQKRSIINDWNIELGEGPYALDLQSEGLDGSLNLNGIALSDIEIRERSGHYELTLSDPNPITMTSFRVFSKSGRDVKLTGLGNLNTPEMVFESIAGIYTLNFSGALQQDMQVHIKFALGSLNLNIPETTRTSVTLTGNYQKIGSSGNWETGGNIYSNPGDGPKLSIVVEMDIGSLNLALE